jgi:hypothetical protein
LVAAITVAQKSALRGVSGDLQTLSTAVILVGGTFGVLHSGPSRTRVDPLVALKYD